MHSWKSETVTWKLNGALYISVPFTWNVQQAIAIANQNKKGKVFMGGPAVFLMKKFIEDKINSNVTILDSVEGYEPITAHNPWATFTSRGCISKCRFCAVPKIEGTFKDIEDFIPRPLVCDNNFLAKSKVQFKKAIDKLKPMPFVDFNQGLDATIFTPDKATALQSLKVPNIRFSFDAIKKEAPVIDAIRLAKSKGFKRVTIYLLYGFIHTIDESEYMGELLRKEKVGICPMRYQPLDTLSRNSFVDTERGWDQHLLRAFQRCFFTTNVPFKDFKNQVGFIDMEDTNGFGFT